MTGTLKRAQHAARVIKATPAYAGFGRTLDDDFESGDGAEVWQELCLMARNDADLMRALSAQWSPQYVAQTLAELDAAMLFPVVSVGQGQTQRDYLAAEM